MDGRSDGTVVSVKQSLEQMDSEIDITSFLVSQGISKDDSKSSLSSDHFFTEDLVWPDPCNVFPKISGIKPEVLTAELKHLNVGSMDLQPKTRCQMAMVVRKRPRPKSLPWNVVVIDSDPPFVEADDVEEYLVHDPLFVEFFNAFLALPSFPEAVCFNIESGGFEVVTDGKLKLAQQIKEAVRSQNTKSDMYDVAHQHAFSDIPVVPIEDTEGPEQVKIERNFGVTALNKEQGIVWVKSARLPIFLESDYYFQYRLGKVISQASIFNEKGEFVVMKIDYTTKPKTKKKTVEVQPPTQEELIVKEMYVSFGDLKGAAKEAWFNQAKMQLKTEPTFTSLSSRVSDSAGDSATTIKPIKKSSVFNSHFFGVYTPGLIGPNDTEPPIQGKNSLEMKSVSRDRPFTPRPSDRIHAATSMMRAKLSKEQNAGEEMVPTGHVVFVWPKQDLQNISNESDLEVKADREAEFAKRMKEHQIIDQIYNDGSWEEGGIGNIVLASVDELGAVIVGAVMKKAISEILSVDEKMIVADPAISCIYPSKDLTCVTVDKLNLCVVVETSQSEDDVAIPTPTNLDDSQDGENLPDRQPVHIKWSKPVLKSAEEDPDEESLLDSDEDFEERDVHFRRNQVKWHSLTTMKGIQAFEKFLTGTQGEKYWQLWIDIDKGRLIRNEEEKQKYIMLMRDKYYKKGSQFELSAENKRKLNLENLSHWIPEHLLKVQAKVLEPLVLYWAPRYLLRHLIHINPEKYYLYNELKASSINPVSDPYPHTRDLLPLRPKSLCPSSKLGYGIGEMINSTYMTNIQDTRTAPRVGNRRVYGEDTIQRLAKTSTAKYLKIGKNVKQKPKSEQIQDGYLSSLSVQRLSGNSKVISDTASELPQNGVFSTDHISQPVIKAPSVLQTSLSQTLPVDSQKQKQSMNNVKSLCPYKSLDAILFGPKHRSPNQGLVKKPKELLLPEVKSAGTRGDKCKGVKTVPVRKIESQDDANYTFFRQDSKDSKKSIEQYTNLLLDGQDLEELQECEFLLSERLEFLLRALHHEQDSGRAFRKYLEKSKREDWMNNLDFWEKVQEYRKLFYKDKLDLHFITKNARSIFAQCIVEGAPQSINISKHIRLSILDHLSPPYEDLFDRAEEYALKLLFEAFRLYIYQDVKNYCEVERAISQRRLETRNTYILDLQKQGIIKERPLTPDDPMEGYVDPVYDDSVLGKVSEKLKGWNMTTLSENKLELEYFRQFLIPRCAEIDLKCWMDMESWRQTAPGDNVLRDNRAIEIKKNYLNKKYFFGPNSPAGKDGQNKVMEVGGGWGKFLEDKPHFNSILKAQKYVRSRLEKKHLPFFLLSRDFKERHQIDVNIFEDEEDTFVLNKKRSLALMKVINDGEEAFETVIENKEKFFINYGLDGGSIVSGDVKEGSFSSVYSYSVKSGLPQHPVLPAITIRLPGQLEDIFIKPVMAKKRDSVASVKLSSAKPKRASITESASSKRVSITESVSGKRNSIKETFSGRRPSKGEHITSRRTSMGESTPNKPASKAESAMSNKESEPTPRGRARSLCKVVSKWDTLVEKHSQLRTATGLIQHITRIPTDIQLLMESKWMTAIREIFLFQRALKNPTSCSQFRKFVSLSGGYLVNDILFWLEVQRYKQMYHTYTRDTLLQQKLNAIVNCFINSFLPPSLQIDIPEEMAQQIMEQKHELSPYIFRQAQLTVFRHLLPHWVAFHEYHKVKGTEEKILSTLARHRAIASGKEQKYREKLAQEREAERLYRLQHPPSLIGDEEDDEDKHTFSFTYSDYLAQQELIDSEVLDNSAKSTQTVRCIPEYRYQPVEERPGYMDDPEVDEDAKHYSIVDYIIYREYFKQEHTKQKSKPHKKGKITKSESAEVKTPSHVSVPEKEDDKD